MPSSNCSIDDDQLSTEAFQKIKQLYGVKLSTVLSTADYTLTLKDSKEALNLNPGFSIQSYLDFNNPLDPTCNRPSPIDEKLDSLMTKSVINNPDFYKNEPLNVHKSKRAIKKFRAELREKTAGKNWFNMKPSELKDGDLVDRELMRMRDVIYSKRLYKKSALKKENQSKFVQIATWQKSPLDRYSKEFTAKTGKKTLVESLLADVDFKKATREKYLDMVSKKNNYIKLSHKPSIKSKHRRGKKESKSNI